MRFLLVALLCALSYAQTAQKPNVKKIIIGTYGKDARKQTAWLSDYKKAWFMPNDTHGVAYPYYFREIPPEYQGDERFKWLDQVWDDEYHAFSKFVLMKENHRCETSNHEENVKSMAHCHAVCQDNGYVYASYMPAASEDQEGKCQCATDCKLIPDSWTVHKFDPDTNLDHEMPIVIPMRPKPFSGALNARNENIGLLWVIAVATTLRLSYVIAYKKVLTKNPYETMLFFALVYSFADLGHGMLHVVCDDHRNLYSKEIVSGFHGAVKGFQIHHIFPYHAGVFGPVAQIADIAHIMKGGIIFGEAINLLIFRSPLFVFGLYSKVALSALGQLAHMWAHQLPETVPYFVFILRRLGLLIGYHSHGLGHHLSHDREYCILAGFPWNETLTWYFNVWQASIEVKNVIALCFLFLDLVGVYVFVKILFREKDVSGCKVDDIEKPVDDIEKQSLMTSV